MRMRATTAKIYIENFRHNLAAVRSRISRTARMCVAVKADAYGHGAVRCAREAVGCGADVLAVATVDEGVQLREAGIDVPVLVLSLCQPEEMDSLVRCDLTPLVFDAEYIACVAGACRRSGKTDFHVHLAVDTGMGRIGCAPDDAPVLAEAIANSGVLALGGMCTHFAVADSLADDDVSYTRMQFDRFLRAAEAVRRAGIHPGICHCANSAATLLYPDMHLDMCRPGIIVYGYYPGSLSEECCRASGCRFSLLPVMALVTKVAAVRRVSAGTSVSYGRTWTASAETDIAVLPVGYGDGMLRRLNENGALDVYIDGRPYPVRGRICMDQCLVELGSDSGVQRWSEAVVFGPKNSGAARSAQDVADEIGTIPYEVTCGISKRVPRVFVE